MRLTLIRHGPTEWNATRRFQGRTDLPLSATGRAHARAIADALRSERFDRIYSSDLVRALQTAEILAEPRNAQVHTDERLREFDFGDWEGLTWSEIVAANPHLMEQGPTAAKRYAPQAGEPYERVCARVESFFADLAEQNVDGVAIVTHAGPLHAIFSVLHIDSSSGPAEDLPRSFTPGGITRLALDNGVASVVTLDDVRHLGGGC
jgi:broad specificity phosphatase PhoE